MTEAAFNLIDEKWIPIAATDPASLRDIYTKADLPALGGNPRQKIAILKLLLAIAQAAATPETDEDWARLRPEGMAQACLAYLEKWHHSFYLYGEKPFLQMPAVARAKLDPIGLLAPETATGNNPRLTHGQCKKHWSDAERAMALVTTMSMCLGSKRGDNQVCLAANYEKKTALPGPGMGYKGLLHSFFSGTTILETIWLNLLSQDNITKLTWLTGGLGTPPWEKMPQTENCVVAQELRTSLQGLLVPLARFCLFDGGGVRFTEGIAHKGTLDISAAMQEDSKKTNMLWADPEKRPWRSLPALLSFLSSSRPKGYFRCPQLELGCRRLALAQINQFGIWSGGLRVSATSGEQRVTASDDMVESEVHLDLQVVKMDGWYDKFSLEMKKLDDKKDILDRCVRRYFASLEGNEEKKGKKSQKSLDAAHAQKATALYWELAERHFQELLDACAAQTEPEKIEVFHKAISRIIYTCYDNVCGRESARQLQAWAKHRPRISWKEEAVKPHVKGVHRRAGAKPAAKQMATVAQEDTEPAPRPAAESAQEAQPAPLARSAETKHNASSAPATGATEKTESKAKKGSRNKVKATGQLGFFD